MASGNGIKRGFASRAQRADICPRFNTPPVEVMATATALRATIFHVHRGRGSFHANDTHTTMTINGELSHYRRLPREIILVYHHDRTVK